MLSLLFVPVRVSDSCVPVILSAHTVCRGDSIDNILSSSSNTDVIITVVDNTGTIIVVPTIINIKASFDIYYLDNILDGVLIPFIDDKIIIICTSLLTLLIV